MDTPFPFPYAQGTVFMLLAFAITTPLQICELVADSATAVVITVFGVTAVAMGEQQCTDSVTMECG